MAPLNRPSRARAFTLLELVLSITLLASMSALIGALWVQAGSWTSEDAGHNRAMKLPRVLELLRAQWGDRRTVVKLNDSPTGVSAGPVELTFITATAILEPGWPIVRASYVIERDYNAPASGLAWRLTYEESPVVSLDQPQGLAGALDASRSPLAPPMRRLVLLSGCAELSWERFGRSRRVEEAELAFARGNQDPDLPSSDPAAGAPAAERIDAWRAFEPTEPAGSPVAVRLVGTFQERDFACVFVIGPSR